MEFVNGNKPSTVEIHVKMSRGELENILFDMRDGCTAEDPYAATEEFMTYLKGL